MKKNKIARRSLYVILSALLLVLCLPIIGYASEGEPVEQIAVQAILPENQLTKDSGYYDLKVTPGQEQELKLKIFNKGDKEVTVKLDINPAATGASGGFIYTLPDSEKDESMKLPISSILETDEFVSLPAKSEIITSIKLSVPQEPFKGILLGGIRVQAVESNEEKEKKEETNGFSIKNSFAYTIAVRLTEEDTLPPSELKLASVAATQLVGRNAIKATIQNPTPTIIEDLEYEGKVFKKEGGEVLYENKVSGYRFAPNSRFDFPISWENNELVAGDYYVEIFAKSTKTQQTWDLKQRFTISKKEAKELNEKAVDLNVSYTKYIYWALLIVFLILVVVFTIVAIWSKNRDRRRFKKEY